MNSLDCIVTDRLILRHLVNEDAQDVFDIMSDDYTAEKIGLRTFTSLSDAFRFIRCWRRESFAITERENDTVIGIIQLPRMAWKKWGIGYWLAEPYRGRGYMSEAVEAVKDYMFNETPCNEIELFVYCGNDASRNLAIKCGFFPVYEKFKEKVYSPYGKIESEEIFNITRADYEWEIGFSPSTFSTAA